MKKKKFKDTKVGSFLIGERGVLDALGDSIPDKGLLGIVKNLVSSNKELDEADKDIAMQLLQLDQDELEGVTRRWEADANSDVKLTKITRQLIIIYLTVCMTLYIVLDSLGLCDIEERWITLLETILICTYTAYFGSRGFEKYAQIKNKK